MPSTYSTRLRFTLQQTGENTNTWGGILNTGVFALVDTAIAGVTTVALTNSDVSLSTANGSADEARAAILKLQGVLTANVNVIIPNNEKVYQVYNGTSGSFTVGIKTSSGTAATITQGRTITVWCDGSNNVRAVGEATASAASETVAGTVELATSAETITGTDNTRAVHPAGLAALTSDTTRKGLIETATTAEAETGTDTERAITPASLKAAVLSIFFPIGSVYCTTDSGFNPNTSWGGTWALYAAGRVLVGQDAGQTEFDTMEEEGGFKVHTLTEAELPAISPEFIVDGSPTAAGRISADGNAANAAGAIFGVSAAGSVDIESFGSGDSHNNLQPYKVVRFWKRVS